MRIEHYETLRPVCPRCRVGLPQPAPLTLASTARRKNCVIFEGTLTCTNPHCGITYPIIDGIPIIVPDLPKFLNDSLYAITVRQDLSELSEAILGEAAGPGAVFNNNRHYLGTYGWDHYGDFAPESREATATQNWQPGSIVSCLNRGLELFRDGVEAPVLDVGCAAGRSALELAARSQGLVLGIDLNILALRLAQRVLHEGRVMYPLKQLGIVYARREYPVQFAHSGRVDFWACDGLALPFLPAVFTFANALNVLDQVSAPLQLLNSMSESLQAGGKALIATPHDWAAPIPMKNWLGGRSPLGAHNADGPEALRTVIGAESSHPSLRQLRLVGEVEHHPWHVRVHNRRTAVYDTQILACEKAFEA